MPLAKATIQASDFLVQDEDRLHNQTAENAFLLCHKAMGSSCFIPTLLENMGAMLSS